MPREPAASRAGASVPCPHGIYPGYRARAPGPPAHGDDAEHGVKRRLALDSEEADDDGHAVARVGAPTPTGPAGHRGPASNTTSRAPLQPRKVHQQPK